MTDICLLLEGTYPYKTGGVSAWVDTLVRGLPELTFSVAHLYYGDKPADPRYSQPANMTGTTTISLNASEGASPLTIGLESLLEQIPKARVYHALSTGFAGYLGTALKRSRPGAFIVTEHGLYWREAELGVGELECGFKIVETPSGSLHLGRTWDSWSDTFRTLARDAYRAADAITTVCEYNMRMQRGLGADAHKTRVIANGIALPAGQTVRALRTGMPPQCALVGRVAPMKDIKTFLRACAHAQASVPDALWSVIGPTDHDPTYFAECAELASALGLRNFSFTGEADVGAWYPRIDVAVLTSASEAQPLALLEAMSYGIPVVSTDVGGVSEIVTPGCAAGNVAAIAETPDGGEYSGLLCPPADPAAVGNAIVRLLTDPALYRACSLGGRRIAERAHDRRVMVGAYRALYNGFLHE